MRLREYFVGIPRDRKQCFINRIGGIVQSIQYLVIKKVINQLLLMKRFQIDLVFEKPSKDENENIYKNMFLTFFLRTSRLKSKDTIEEANQLKRIYMTFDSLLILQCDKVLEFQGILLLIYCLHLLTG